MSKIPERKSPKESATLYKLGTKKTGLDGNMWIITETSNGVKRWKLFKKTSKETSKKTSKKISKKTSKKVSKKASKETSKRVSKKSKPLIYNENRKLNVLVVNSVATTNSFIKRTESKIKKTYNIHYNGDRPYRVIIENGIINVYKKENNKYDNLILTIKKYIGYWYGIDLGNSYPNHNGNSILIQETITKYIYIGNDIITFETTEEILDYVSPIGHNDVPYPLALSLYSAYFFTHYEYVDKRQFEVEPTIFNSMNTYSQYFFSKKMKPQKNKFKKINYIVKYR